MTKGVSHSLFDDVQAILLASLFMSFGVALFTQQEFLIGGTAGVAFLGSYASSWSFGQLFFVINIPFYGLALWRLGWFFTVKKGNIGIAISVLIQVLVKVLGLDVGDLVCGIVKIEFVSYITLR